MYVTTKSKWVQMDATQRDRYNCWDVVATARSYRGLREELQSNGQWEFYEREVWPTVPVVLAMQERGLGFDPVARAALREQLTEERADVERRIKAAATFAINLNSTHHRARLLFEDLQFKPPKITGTGKRSTDQETLVKILQHLRKRDEPNRAVLENLFHRSRLNTILTRYLKVEDREGRVYPRIKMYGAETGRMAYADPALQQYPKEARILYRASPGCHFVAADYSQLEARILAVLAQDRTSLAAFAAGEDIHRSNARDLFGKALDQVVDVAPYRNFAKGFLYGISYGGSPETMKTKLFCPCPRCADKVPPTVKLPRSQITEASQRWFAIHEPVLRFRERLAEQVRQHHFYVNPLGRKRYFCTPWPSVERELYNFPMQSTAADIINRAMRVLHEEYNAPIVLQMHDSLMLEVPSGTIAHWSFILREVMERPVAELDGTTFPVDVEVGESWGDMKTWNSSGGVLPT